MKLRLKHSDKQVIAEKLMEFGNIVFGGLVVSQVFLNQKFDILVAVLGIIVLFSTFLIAIIYLRGSHNGN